ncbi:potassium-transporting ATPase subunit KdpC [Demequina sp. NBRC 110057]|uniref:potassium-transporting ATPase subunit KdpC n=1 Tax=Demequina sp. NBRC 110057 TaxID=1570346 RepID=UPI000A05DE00|nr:potassium-transporting ATPase subunit KdpC [Demequina sp. NBRC 110057]
MHSIRLTTSSSLRALARSSLTGLKMLAAFTVVCGVAYPLLITGVAKAAFPWQAAGSLVTATGERTTDRGEAAGSALIGQSFEGDAWFLPRPSAAGDGYDTLASGGSNLGPESPDVVASIAEGRAEVAAREGVDVSQVPADAVTASGSGLDGAISPAYAALQVPRVARERGLDEATVAALVADATHERTLGVLGDPYVDVLALNTSLEQAAPADTM